MLSAGFPWISHQPTRCIITAGRTSNDFFDFCLFGSRPRDGCIELNCLDSLGKHLPCRPRSPCSFSGMHSTWFNRIQPHSTCWTCLTIGVVSFPDPALHSWDSDNIFDDQGAITDSLFPSCKAREDAFLGDTMRCGSQVAQPMTPIYTHTHTSAFV